MQRAGKLAAGDPIVLREVSQALVAAEKEVQAIPFLRQLAAMNPEDPGCWSSLAWAYLAAGRYAEAREAILEAIDLDPYNPAFPAGLERLEELLKSTPSSEEREGEAESPSGEAAFG